ncbi:matrixin family metalloprotease [Candidatus Kaiserbacteria bacterium]|nr:matrixin family metalloprotease [Candidatus Kaiserbacteria bacterium]
MRLRFLLSLLLTVGIALTTWYHITEYDCPAPLHYRLGNLDSDFALSRDEARNLLKHAESYWENPTNRELFIYDEAANFTVEFIFDERQELADAEEKQHEVLDEKRQESEEVRQTIEELQAEYDSLTAAYQEAAAEYEIALSEYNRKVNKYNDRGGAPADIYEELQSEREGLNQEADKLNRTAKELNSLADKINELGEQGNRLVNDYNREVNKYNASFVFDQEFTQGDYQGSHINIYKFSSEAELLNVLGHEYGHALGIGHVDDSSALMYYLLEETDSEPTLATSDLQAFYEVCGYEESFGQKIRRLIRDLLNNI